MISLIEHFINTRLFFWLRWGQFALALTVFTGLALLPSTYINQMASSDKSLHFLGNMLLFGSAWVAFFGRMKIGLVIILLVPYSLLVEVAQWLAPSRQVDYQDMLANMAGLLAGYVVANVIEWYWARLTFRYSGD